MAIAPLWEYALHDYQRNRVLAFINPALDPATAWQPRQAMNAVGSGRFIGKGFLQGTQIRLAVNHSPISAPVPVCVSADAGDCDCGFIFYNRCQPGFACTCPSFGDAGAGVCLTYQQKAVLCAGELAKYFACSSNNPLDAGPYDTESGGIP